MPRQSTWRWFLARRKLGVPLLAPHVTDASPAETSYLTLFGGLPIEGTLAARTNLEGPLRQKLREMDRIMTNVNNLLGDDVITKRHAAAVKIQAAVRGHIARLQMGRAVFAARTWRRHEFAQMRSLLLDWVRWREVVELKIKAVRASNSRLLMKEITTRWRDMAMGMLPVRAEQEKRAAEVSRGVWTQDSIPETASGGPKGPPKRRFRV